MRGMIRQMMLHHTKHVKDTRSRIQQARALLSFIADSTEGQETPYAKVIKQELDLLGKHPDSYLFHEHLEENNQPLFFYEFLEMAHEHSLQFVGETNLASMITSNLPAKAAEALSALTNDVHHRSQYTDFVTNRMFRQTLLCHKGCQVTRHIDQSSLDGIALSGNFTADDPKQLQDLSPDVEVAYKCANGRGIKTSNSALKALILSLAEAWPSSLTIPELCESVKKKLSEVLVVGQPEETSISQIVCVNMLQMLVRGDIEFRYLPDRFISTVSDKPKVSPLTILQANTEGAITSHRHNMFNADPLTKLILKMLDGEHSKADLVDYLGKLAAEGKLNVTVKGEAPADMRPIHTAAIEKILAQLRRSAVLIA